MHLLYLLLLQKRREEGKGEWREGREGRGGEKFQLAPLIVPLCWTLTGQPFVRHTAHACGGPEPGQLDLRGGEWLGRAGSHIQGSWN